MHRVLIKAPSSHKKKKKKKPHSFPFHSSSSLLSRALGGVSWAAAQLLAVPSLCYYCRCTLYLRRVRLRCDKPSSAAGDDAAPTKRGGNRQRSAKRKIMLHTIALDANCKRILRRVLMGSPPFAVDYLPVPCHLEPRNWIVRLRDVIYRQAGDNNLQILLSLLLFLFSVCQFLPFLPFRVTIWYFVKNWSNFMGH